MNAMNTTVTLCGITFTLSVSKQQVYLETSPHKPEYRCLYADGTFSDKTFRITAADYDTDHGKNQKLSAQLMQAWVQWLHSDTGKETVRGALSTAKSARIAALKRELAALEK